MPHYSVDVIDLSSLYPVPINISSEGFVTPSVQPNVYSSGMDVFVNAPATVPRPPRADIGQIHTPVPYMMSPFGVLQ